MRSGTSSEFQDDCCMVEPSTSVPRPTLTIISQLIPRRPQTGPSIEYLNVAVSWRRFHIRDVWWPGIIDQAFEN